MDTPTNIDLLAWFETEERSECPECGERACLTLDDAPASFCLACGAVTIEGVSIAIGPQHVA